MEQGTTLSSRIPKLFMQSRASGRACATFRQVQLELHLER